MSKKYKYNYPHPLKEKMARAKNACLALERKKKNTGYPYRNNQENRGEQFRLVVLGADLEGTNFRCLRWKKAMRHGVISLVRKYWIKYKKQKTNGLHNYSKSVETRRRKESKALKTCWEVSGWGKVMEIEFEERLEWGGQIGVHGILEEVIRKGLLDNLVPTWFWLPGKKRHAKLSLHQKKGAKWRKTLC